MKKLLIFASILLLFVTCKKENDNKDNCKQDFIIAGDSLNSCCEIIKIDTSFNVYGNTYGKYELDLDNDNRIDMTFEFRRSSAWHGNSVNTGCYMKSENPLLEFSIEDGTQYSTYIKVKNAGDTIGINDEWFSNEDGRINLSDLNYLIVEYGDGSGNTWISYSDSTNINVRNKYIGIRIKQPSFTEYYWIKLSVKFTLQEGNVFIEEFGRQKR